MEGRQLSNTIRMVQIKPSMTRSRKTKLRSNHLMSGLRVFCFTRRGRRKDGVHKLWLLPSQYFSLADAPEHQFHSAPITDTNSAVTHHICKRHRQLCFELLMTVRNRYGALESCMIWSRFALLFLITEAFVGGSGAARGRCGCRIRFLWHGITASD